MKESLRSQVESELQMARNKIANITKEMESRTCDAIGQELLLIPC